MQDILKYLSEVEQVFKVVDAVLTGQPTDDWVSVGKLSFAGHTYDKQVGVSVDANGTVTFGIRFVKVS